MVHVMAVAWESIVPTVVEKPVYCPDRHLTVAIGGHFGKKTVLVIGGGTRNNQRFEMAERGVRLFSLKRSRDRWQGSYLLL